MLKLNSNQLKYNLKGLFNASPLSSAAKILHSRPINVELSVLIIRLLYSWWILVNFISCKSLLVKKMIRLAQLLPLRVFIVEGIKKELCHPPVKCDFNGASGFGFNHPFTAEGILIVTGPARGEDHSSGGWVVASTRGWRRRGEEERDEDDSTKMMRDNLFLVREI